MDEFERIRHQAENALLRVGKDPRANSETLEEIAGLIEEMDALLYVHSLKKNNSTRQLGALEALKDRLSAQTQLGTDSSSLLQLSPQTELASSVKTVTQNYRQIEEEALANEKLISQLDTLTSDLQLSFQRRSPFSTVFSEKVLCVVAGVLAGILLILITFFYT